VIRYHAKVPSNQILTEDGDCERSSSMEKLQISEILILHGVGPITFNLLPLLYVCFPVAVKGPLSVLVLCIDGNAYWRSASNRSTGRARWEFVRIVTFVRLTLGFSRRLGVAWNTCSSLMGCNGSIRADKGCRRRRRRCLTRIGTNTELLSNSFVCVAVQPVLCLTNVIPQISLESDGSTGVP
jgi:hypothetical protein